MSVTWMIVIWFAAIPLGLIIARCVVEGAWPRICIYRRPEPRGFEVIPMARVKRSGFSFVEVMFAVIILGVGFIMIAAMFPVAISQSKRSVDETVAARYAQSMQATLLHRRGGWLPDSPTVSPAAPGTPLWSALASDMVYGVDNRYAATAAYITKGNIHTVSLFILNHADRYFDADLEDTAPGVAPNLQLRGVDVEFTSDGSGATVDQIIRVSGVNADTVAEGAYLIIADDNSPGVDRHRLTGEHFRVGNRRRDLDTATQAAWELDPSVPFRGLADPDGTGPQQEITGLDAAACLVMGRRLTPSGYEGNAQDVAFYVVPLPR